MTVGPVSDDQFPVGVTVGGEDSEFVLEIEVAILVARAVHDDPFESVGFSG